MPEDKAEEIRIGVYICHCGTNIAGTVDVSGLSKFSWAGPMPGRFVTKSWKLKLIDPTQWAPTRTTATWPAGESA